MKRRWLWISLSLVVATGITGMSVSGSAVEYPLSPQFKEGRFRNATKPRVPEGRESASLWWKFLTGKQPGTRPSAPIPVSPITAEALAAAQEGELFRLGHSTVLMRLDGGWWITDPVFSERASPVSWAGPKRFQPAMLALEDLPPLKGVLISHDHYDHLDKATIIALARRAETFITPLGVGDLIQRWGVPADRIHQLDWWQSYQAGQITFTATPAQHFSGRGLFDRDRRLWASWAIRTPSLNLFFSGDSGYFDGFAEIGRRLGPFDLTLVECGAYDPLWSGVHMLPEQTVQAHIDLRGRWLVPIHNSTFDLAFHDWYAPMEQVLAAARQRQVAIAMPLLGQGIDPHQPPPLRTWWRGASGRELAAE
ncbi:MBL fold metallo-hydrolase [Stenotrophomonas sp. HITSZ_GD]|uniref:MBL fold metallo-hydrolase n=1 Tax=Stenotrophomonas sp. HITSZ_GD TaxID=3037248 RepID=UPI00240D2D2D|nr:MBL fold metallo-hydrolase [Stenotrophomonas sp. HITSZ_GD]MDG2523901.1 MBL fold metallo-hydrolase [Stenotrophomonas sp. HITSZ_GD]